MISQLARQGFRVVSLSKLTGMGDEERGWRQILHRTGHSRF
jgi:hypothetical protein